MNQDEIDKCLSATTEDVYKNEHRIRATLLFKKADDIVSHKCDNVSHKITKNRTKNEKPDKFNINEDRGYIDMVFNGNILILTVCPKENEYDKQYTPIKCEYDIQYILTRELNALEYAYDGTLDEDEIEANVTKMLYTDIQDLTTTQIVRQQKLPVYVFVFSTYQDPVCGAIL